MDSVRTQFGMLVMVTSQTDEITRSSGVNLNLKFKNIRLIKSLTTFAKYRPIEEVKIAMVGFISILGNLRSVRQS